MLNRNLSGKRNGNVILTIVFVLAAMAMVTLAAHWNTSFGSIVSASAAKPDDVPLVTLYDQLNNPGTISTSSQDFETANNAFDDFLADDFVVPAGQTWTINEVDAQGVYFNGPGPAASFNVFFHTNTGTLPLDPAIYTATGQA